MGKNKKNIFFSIFGIRMTQFTKKKQKKFFGLFDPWTCLGLAWACPWPKMASKWVKMNFPEHGVNRKVVDNGLIHLNVQYERSS